MPNPYADRPAGGFWKTGVAALATDAVMPIPARRFSLEAGARIATAGSCFAQEVGKYLANMPGVSLLCEEAVRPDQPLFSALYGNIYTVRQLVQLFDRAFGDFVPVDAAWQRKDGRFVDPFRPYVFAAGFAGADDAAAARIAHLAAVRRVFADSSVFVFTLGLTETWCAVADRAVFPVAPGVVSPAADPAAYRFHNFTYGEVTLDLRHFIARFRDVNPTARIILTVSPVPLTATYTSEHVLVATAHSKAILRAACSEIVGEYDFVYYFPSYEIISGHFNRGKYYSENLRTVTAAGVAHVMKVFGVTYLINIADDGTGAAAGRLSAVEAADEPVCDEEEIVRSVGFD